MMLRQTTHDKTQGFTLIEITLVILLLGLFIMAFAAFQQLAHKKIVYERTARNMVTVEQALANFIAIHDRLPCPARLTAGPGAADAGVENCTPGPGIFADATGRVLTGAVPTTAIISGHRVSILPYADTLDGWGNRLTYAVTRTLADGSLPRYDSAYGAISAVDESGSSLTFPPSVVNYAIVSHGRTAQGAYNSQGIPIAPCNNTARDGQNCDRGSEFNLSGRIDADVDFYDDIVSAKVEPGKPNRKMIDSIPVCDANQRLDFDGTNFICEVIAPPTISSCGSRYVQGVDNNISDCSGVPMVDGVNPSYSATATSPAGTAPTVTCPPGHYLTSLSMSGEYKDVSYYTTWARKGDIWTETRRPDVFTYTCQSMSVQIPD